MQKTDILYLVSMTLQLTWPTINKMKVCAGGIGRAADANDRIHSSHGRVGVLVNSDSFVGERERHILFVLHTGG